MIHFFDNSYSSLDLEGNLGLYAMYIGNMFDGGPGETSRQLGEWDTKPSRQRSHSNRHLRVPSGDRKRRVLHRR